MEALHLAMRQHCNISSTSHVIYAYVQCTTLPILDLRAIVGCVRAEMRQREGVFSCRDGCCSCACRVRCGLTAVKLSAVLLLATCCSQCPRRMCPVLHPTLHTSGHTVSVHHDTCAFQGCTVGSACQVVLGQGGQGQSARCSMLL